MENSINDYKHNNIKRILIIINCITVEKEYSWKETADICLSLEYYKEQAGGSINGMKPRASCIILHLLALLKYTLC